MVGDILSFWIVAWFQLEFHFVGTILFYFARYRESVSSEASRKAASAYALDLYDTRGHFGLADLRV